MLDRMLRVTLLYDCYGALLTEKQQQCIELHYLNDLSLGEIAQEYKVTRQATYDILKRSLDILENYEEKLHFVQKYTYNTLLLREAYDIVCGFRSKHENMTQELDKVLHNIEQVME